MRKTKNKNRDAIIDFLRAIGILAIILAHVSPPAIIAQIRNSIWCKQSDNHSKQRLSSVVNGYWTGKKILLVLFMKDDIIW